MTDLDLLRQYSHEGSEEAFAALVACHLNLVYATALRQVRSPQLAEDVAQSVFLSLARNSKAMKPGTVLAAWLYRVTRHAAIDLMRGETRRQAREQTAFELGNMKSDAAEWAHVEPLLDEALEALDETDRSAILLRYFENKSLREVGETLGTSEDAAQKRVSRAVEQLRGCFTGRGIAVSATVLIAGLCAQATSAAPVGLSAAITAAALAAPALQITATATTAKAIAMTTLQKTIIAATIAVAAGAGIYQARQASAFRTRAQTIEQQQAPLAEQVRQLTGDRDEAVRQLEAARDENERLSRNTAELLKLRGENTRLRIESQELAKLKASLSSEGSSAKSWLARVRMLKQRLEQRPEQSIPELRYLNEYDWLTAARPELKTDKDFRQALGRLRMSGESKFAEGTVEALQEYLKANNDEFPAQLSQLQPYFSPLFQPPVNDAILQRWQIVPATNRNASVWGEEWVITQKAPVDDEYDDRLWIGSRGQGGGGMGSFKLPEVLEVVANTNVVKEANIDPRDAAAVSAALKAFSAANNGQQVTNSAQLLPYLATPEKQAALLRLSGEMGIVGVGLSSQGDANPPRIQRVVSASSAEKAGIETGSLLLSIDGVNTVGKSMEEWTSMIRGRVGTTVTLEIVDPAMSRTNIVTLVRAKM